MKTVEQQTLQALAEHPWRVFWLLGVPLLGAAAAVIAGLVLLNVDASAVSPATRQAFRLFIYVAMLVFALAGIQGLRVTWLRARWKAAVFVLLFLISNLLETFGMPRTAADLSAHLYSDISLPISWALASWSSHWMSRRLTAARAVEVI